MPELELPVIECSMCHTNNRETDEEYCATCLLNTDVCDHCDVRLRDSNFVIVGEAHHCAPCTTILYNNCVNCCHLVQAPQTVCETCLENYIECTHCNSRHHRDRLVGVEVAVDGERETQYFCPSCADQVYNCDCGHYHLIDTPCLTRRPPLPKIKQEECLLPLRVFALEVETNISADAPKGWVATDDGSIGGYEYLTGPIVGNDALERIRRGCDYFNDYAEDENVDVVDYRCGLHLHINALDKSEIELIRFCHMAMKYEDDFFSLVPQSRVDTPRSSQYCKPLPQRYNNIFFYKTLRDAVYDYNFNKKSISKYYSERYYWVNMHSYFYRGTVEIRLHSGTANKNKIINWVELWLRFFDYACENKYTGIPFFEMLQAAKVQDSTIEFYKQRQLHFSEGKE